MPPKSTAQKRLARELNDIQKNAPPNCRVSLAKEDNLFEWQAEIDGAEGSPYEEGCFQLSIVIAPDYPFRPPQVSFKTRIYHPNINSTGAICLDILKTKWSPALSLLSVVLSIQSLLTDPNPADPLVPDIARLYTQNRSKFDSNAKEWTRIYAPKSKSKYSCQSSSSSSSSQSQASKSKGVHQVIDLTETSPQASTSRSTAPPVATGRRAAREKVSESASGSGPGTRTRSATAREVITLD